MPYYDPNNPSTWTDQAEQSEAENQLMKAKYLQTTQPSGSGGGADMSGWGTAAGQLYKAYSTPAMVGGEAAPVAGSQSGVGAAANSSVASSSAPAASSGSFGSTMAAAGPWAALAAAIVANESKQRGDGNRPEDKTKWGEELISGQVLERDADRYLPNNEAGDIGRKLSKLGNPKGTYETLQDGFDKLKGMF